MNARDVAIAVVALLIGCLGPTAALTAGLQSATGAAPVIVGALIERRCWEAPACYFAAMTRTRFRNRKISLSFSLELNATGLRE